MTCVCITVALLRKTPLTGDEKPLPLVLRVLWMTEMNCNFLLLMFARC